MVCLQICNLSKDTEAVVDVSGGSSVMGLRITMTVLPIIGLLIALLYFKLKYLLTEEKITEIENTLKARN